MGRWSDPTSLDAAASVVAAEIRRGRVVTAGGLEALNATLWRLPDHVAASAHLLGFRRAFRLTQNQCSRALGVSQNTISRWERATSSIENPRLLSLAIEAASTAMVAQSMQEPAQPTAQQATRPAATRGGRFAAAIDE